MDDETKKQVLIGFYWINAGALTALIAVLAYLSTRKPRWALAADVGVTRHRWWWDPFVTMAVLLAFFLFQYGMRLLTVHRPNADGGRASAQAGPSESGGGVADASGRGGWLPRAYSEFDEQFMLGDVLIAVLLAACAVQIAIPPERLRALARDAGSTVRFASASVVAAGVLLLAGFAPNSAEVFSDLIASVVSPLSTACGLWAISFAIAHRFEADGVDVAPGLRLRLRLVRCYGIIQFSQTPVFLHSKEIVDVPFAFPIEVAGMGLSFLGKFPLAWALAALRDERLILLIRSLSISSRTWDLSSVKLPAVADEAAAAVRRNMDQLVRDVCHPLRKLKHVREKVEAMARPEVVDPRTVRVVRELNAAVTMNALCLAWYDQRLGKIEDTEFDVAATIADELRFFDTFDSDTFAETYETGNYSRLKGIERVGADHRFFDFDAACPAAAAFGAREVFRVCVHELLLNALKYSHSVRPRVSVVLSPAAVVCVFENSVDPSRLGAHRHRLESAALGFTTVKSMAGRAGWAVEEGWAGPAEGPTFQARLTLPHRPAAEEVPR